MKPGQRKAAQIRRDCQKEIACPTCRKPGVITHDAIVCECGKRWTPTTAIALLRLGFPERANSYAGESQRLALCPKCGGTGDVKCKDCDGAGWNECPHCRHDIDCETCGGAGVVDCEACEGTGRETESGEGEA